MIYFPNISAPSYPLKVKIENNSLASKFEDGTLQSRPKFTRSRRTFTVSWQSLKQEEYLILDDFIRNVVRYSAETFYWKNPATYNIRNGIGEEYVEVRIVNVGDATMNVLNYWSIDLTLEEV